MPERGPGCQGGSGAQAPDVPLGRVLRGLFAGGVCGAADAADHGLRLHFAAGTTVRFEPGIPVDVELVPLAGRRIVPGPPDPGRKRPVRPGHRRWSHERTARRQPARY
ncbi:urease subunit beta [Streptomyces sp. NBC_00846]|uniref:urease subunit beta n=1 Tax=Streptomyces sp. NBC_00846 TaxID=2975849 RepID=UPI003869FE56|nr:urease subunit beta [Streptomyces sp. NBC_00846]